MIENAVVYAIGDKTGICYVGSTVDFARRITQHIRKRGPQLTGKFFWVLRIAESDKAIWIEDQIITALRKRGQCGWNVYKKQGQVIRGRGPTSYRLRVMPGNFIFNSLQQVGRFLNCAGQTVSNAISKENGQWGDWTITRI